MNARTHRIIVAVTSALASLSALWAATDTSAFGLNQQEAALIAFLLAGGSVVATAVRSAWEQ